MKKSKITFLKEKQLEKKAKESFGFHSKFVQNPIIAKALAFRDAKKDIEPKDIL